MAHKKRGINMLFIGRRCNNQVSSSSNRQRLAALLSVLILCWLLVSREEFKLQRIAVKTAGTKSLDTTHQTGQKGPLFHLVFTVPNFSTLNLRCIESIFYFHPEAQLKIHSNAFYGVDTSTASGSTSDSSGAVAAKERFSSSIKALRDLGYHIEILPYSAAEVLDRAVQFAKKWNSTWIDTDVAGRWASQLSTWKDEVYWFSNEANLLRLCLLYTEGGIYLDTDVILVRPMVPVHRLGKESPRRDMTESSEENGLVPDNTMARDNWGWGSFHNAVLKFLHPGNPFMAAAITDFLSNYNGTVWGNNGPWVFGRLAKNHPSLICADLPESSSGRSNNGTDSATIQHESSGCWMQPVPEKTFQPVPWQDWKDHCFDADKSPVNDDARRIMTAPGVHAVHLNNHLVGKQLEEREYVPHSVCDYLLHEYCILCSENNGTAIGATESVTKN